MKLKLKSLKNIFSTWKRTLDEKINSEDDMEQDLPSQQIENTKDVVYKFLEEHLQIENPNGTIEFQRIHRLGKPAVGKRRPIIARFLRYKDKERTEWNKPASY